MSDSPEPEFREPAIEQYAVGDEFHWTHERSIGKYVSLDGTVVETFSNRIQVDVGNSNYYEINELGRVVSISPKFKRTSVGYCVHR